MRSLSKKPSRWLITPLLLVLTYGALAAGDQSATASVGCSFVRVRVPGPGTYPEIADIKALAENDVWAVGSYAPGSESAPLVEHWNGTDWSVVSAPTAGARGAALQAVAATTPSNIWAVGYLINGTNKRGGSKTIKGLVEHSDGTQWSIVATPHIDQSYELFGVSADSPTDTWVVGQRYTHPGGTPTAGAIVEHWNGTSWRVFTAGLPTYVPDTADIAARSPSDVWVAYGGIIEHWNGATWNVQLRANGYVLSSVSKMGWALGGGGSAQSMVTFRWNGRSWTSVPTPPLDGDTYPSRIRGFSQSSMWLVGGHADPGAGTAPLIEHWNGSKWSLATQPAPPAHSPQAEFLGVTVVNATGEVWTGGSYWDRKRDEPLPLVDHRTC